MNFFYIPALLLILFFVLGPLLEAIRISFTQWNGYSQDYKYIGWRNYLKLFQDPNFRTAFRNTIIYGFGSTLLQNLLGLAYAVFLNTRFRGHSIVRTFIYMPVMISSLIMGYIIYFFVQYNGGIFNEIIGLFGKEPIDWMADGNRGVIIITLMNSWQYVGLCMVVYLAGLQNIPDMYREAARLDGVGHWQEFRYITLPLLIPSITTAVVINLINGLKMYDMIVAMSSGGPNRGSLSLSYYIQLLYFNDEKAGYAAALGVVTIVVIMILTLPISGFLRRKEVEY